LDHGPAPGATVSRLRYMAIEHKEVLVQDFYGPVEAVDAVRKAMDLYREHYPKH
jgi:hypothetical protein